MKEIWKAIEGFPNYQVSNMGRVRARASKTVKDHKKGEIYEPKYRYPKRKHNKNGGLGNYCILALYNNGVRKDIALHRLVAKYFVPNPDNLPQVNHIDGNKHNNRADNLEWCTNSENQTHAYKTGLQVPHASHKRKILQYDLNGNFIKLWSSITEADFYYANRRGSSIGSCLRNRTKTAYGYIWKYESEMM